MIDARLHWWNEIEHFISKSPLHHQQTLYFLAKHAREFSGGETACCGTFLPHFVAGLPDNDRPVDKFEGKLILKLFKRIAGGCRKLLRSAAEAQLGPLGVNLRQSTITDFFKSNSLPVSGRPSPTGESAPVKKKNRTEILYLNKDLLPNDIFYTTTSTIIQDFYYDILYWEFKVG